MKIGVTGTRNGMNDFQRENVTKALENMTWDDSNEFHHGDCIGVDVQAAEIAYDLDYQIICHPPTEHGLRGFFERNHAIRSPGTYFARNRNIVNETDHLFVVPMQNERQNFGGTWYTMDYAKKKEKPLTVFYPDGRVESLVYDIEGFLDAE